MHRTFMFEPPKRRNETTALTSLEERAHFFRSLSIPGLFYSPDHFPATRLENTQRERADNLKKFLAAEDLISPTHRAESEACWQKVAEVVDSYDRLVYVSLTAGQSREFYHLISVICGVAWLADKIVLVPSDYTGARPPTEDNTSDAEEPTGSIAEMFPAFADEPNFLALTAGICKHKGWTFHSAGGTATGVYLCSYTPYTFMHIVVVQVTLKETGPPEYDPFFVDYIKLTSAGIFKIHKLLFWLANENGGRLHVRQTLNPRHIYDGTDDTFLEDLIDYRT